MSQATITDPAPSSALTSETGGERLHIALLAAALPPQLDGIGDYSANMAAALARQHRVTIYTVTQPEHTPIPGVEIVPAFDIARPASVGDLLSHWTETPPDWVLLQYNPFWYGSRGYNPYLPQTLWKARARMPEMRLAIMAHETFMPWMKLSWSVMNLWQYPQFYALGKMADIVFLSIEPWALRFQKWFPEIPVRHGPIPSGIPRQPLTRQEARQRLGIGEDTFVLGLFGTAHPSRLFDWVGEAYRAVSQENRDSLLLYIGPHREEVVKVCPELPILADGPFAGEEVSRRLAATDLMLAPYIDGVSTRRSAFMAGLQHGIATIGTTSVNTDALLNQVHSEAVLLAPYPDQAAFNRFVLRLLHDPEERRRIALNGLELYNTRFDTEPVCRAFMEAFATIRRK